MLTSLISLALAGGASCPLPAAPPAVITRETEGILAWTPGLLAPPLDRRPHPHLRVATFALG